MIAKWIFLLVLPGLINGTCDYTTLTSTLNTCVATASASTNTKWFFPYATIAEQAAFCVTAAQTTLATCITSTIYACRTDTKVTALFGTTGDNLVSAYTALCASTYITEAQACMSVISSITTYTTAEYAFTTAVVALQSSPSNIEICGLFTTLKYTAYTTLITPTCTTSTHLAVWTAFYDTIMNTYVCTCAGSFVTVSGGILFFSLMLTFGA